MGKRLTGTGHDDPTPAASSQWKRLILPLILSVVPILVGFWEVRRLEEFYEARELRNLRKTSDPLAARLSVLTAPAFWPREVARRVQERLRTGLARSGNPGFGALLARALKKTGLKAIPRLKIWAVEVTASSPLKVEICRKKGFQTEKASLFRMLLREICLESWKGMSDLPKWENRLGTMFGAAISSDFFARSFRGRPFPVSTADGYGYLVWDVFFVGKVPVGAYLLFFPSGENEITHGMDLALANWRMGEVLPAFITLPSDFGGRDSRIHMHPRLQEEASLAILTRLRDQMRPAPPPDASGDALGMAWLPAALEGRVVKSCGMWFRVCRIAPETGAVGILLGKIPRPINSISSGFMLIFGGILALAWGVLLLRGFFLGLWPDLNIEWALLLWFLGLASVPIVMGTIAGAEFLINHEENLKDQLIREMRLTLAGIESETSRLEVAQEMGLRDIFGDPELPSRLRDLQVKGDVQGLSRFKKELWQNCGKRNMHLWALLICGHRGFFSYIENLGMGPAITKNWLELLRSSWGAKLGTETPEIGRLLPPPESAVVSNVFERISGPFRGAFQGTTLIASGSSPEIVFLQKFLGSNTSMTRFFEPDETLWGKANAMSIVAPVIFKDSLLFTIGFLWNQDRAYKEFFREKIVRLSRMVSGSTVPFRLCVMKSVDGKIEGVFPRKLAPALGEMVERMGERKALVEIRQGTVPTLICILPSQKAKGFLLVAHASLEPLQRQLMKDALGMAGLFVFSVIFLAVASVRISGWLGGPLVRMSQGLGLISGGQLDIEVSEPREDELGDAGRVLDGMTRALRERRTLTRFVAPQVIEAVSGGDLKKSLEGQIRHVAILDSDIRNFTTISETRSPHEVFSALNEHLKAMTTVIHAAGGVIDRFIGDAVVAVFYPTEGSSPEERALEAARGMMVAHSRITSERESKGAFSYSIGIGIDSGPVLAGAVGDEEVRLDFSVLGEPQTRAAFLEGLSKLGRASRIIVSEKVGRMLSRNSSFVPIPGHEDAWEYEAGEPSSSAPESQVEPEPIPFAPEKPFGPEIVAGGQTSRQFPDKFKGREEGTVPNARSGTSTSLMSGFAPLWVGGFILVAAASGLLFKTGLEAEEERIRSLFLEKAGLVNERLDLGSHLSRELEVRLNAPPGMRPEDSLGAASLSTAGVASFPVLVSARMASLEKMFPQVQWAMVGFPRCRSSETAVVSDLVLESGRPGALFPAGSGTEELPGPGWVQTNVGMAVSPPPIISRGGRQNISGGGITIEDPEDSFHFVHRPGKGDLRLACSIFSFDAMNPLARAGLMARQGTGRGANFLGLFVSPSGEVSIVTRSRPSSRASVVFSISNASFPVCLKLEKRARVWAGFVSVPGGEWRELSPKEGDVSRFRPDGGASAGEAFRDLPTVTFDPGESPEVGIAVCGALNPDSPSTMGTHLYGHHGFPVEWERHLVPLCHAGMTAFSMLEFGLLHPAPGYDRWLKEELPGLIGESASPESVFLNINNKVRWNWFGGEQKFCFFRVMYENDLVDGGFELPAERSREAVQIPEDDFVRKRSFENSEQSRLGFLFVFEPSGSWVEFLAGRITEELAKEGFKFALVKDDQLLELGETSREFFPGGILSKAFEDLMPGIRGIGNREVYTSDRFDLHGRKVQFMIARRLLPQDVVSWISPVPGVFLAGWMVLGLFWIASMKFRIPFPGLRSLRGRLVFSFLAAVLPSFTLAFCMVERSGIEAKTRIRAETRDQLTQLLEQSDRSYDLFSGWTRSLLRAQTDSKVLFPKLVADRPGLLPENQIESAMEAALEGIAKRGVAPLRVIFSLDKGKTTVISTDPTSNPEKDQQIWSVFMELTKAMRGDSSDPLVRNPGRSQDSSILIQSEAENIRDACRLLLGNEMICEMIQRPETWHFMVLGGRNRSTLYRRKVGAESGSQIDLAIDLGSADQERLLIQSVASMPEEWKTGEMEIRFFHRYSSIMECTPPFYRTKWEGKKLPDTEFIHSAPPPELYESLCWAEKSREPVFLNLRSGPDESLNLLFPLGNFPGWVILGTLPVGKHLVEAGEGVREAGIALLGLLLVTVFLARGVAGQFLVPVKNLIRGCNYVVAGDYSIRLPTSFGGEFRVLSEAFNSMAREAQEGRLMRRFVSDSVLEIANKRSLDPEILEGRACRAVVLFAQLSSFKSFMESSPPEIVVKVLNSFLRVMSSIVRENGGEIDKFIGDKILAVVHGDSAGNLDSPVLSALRIAQDMRQGMGSLEFAIPTSLGIGIVAGPVLAGILGTPELRLEFTVIGDNVNLASRLSDLAIRIPGGATIAEEGFVEILTRKLPPGQSHLCQPLPPVKVKGKANEVRIFRLADAGGSPIPRGSL